MELIGGIVIIATLGGAVALGRVAKRHPADAEANQDTGITEREWSDAIR